MTAVSRTAQFAKVHKILKKHYKPASANPGRTVMEHLIFACCLEDARYEAAEEAFAALVHTFFDWNEVRVTSISELSEVMACLPDPRLAANRIKRVLHAIFEAQFNFDLEDKRKKNLGPTIKWLEGLDGTSRFSVAYVVQAALGGHSIPIDTGTMAVLRLLDLVTDKDAAAGEVPGLERAIAKSKGVEFGSLLHQFGADFSANPYSPTIRGILLEINPDVQNRLPKRRVEPQLRKKAAEQPPPPNLRGSAQNSRRQTGASRRKNGRPQKNRRLPSRNVRTGRKKTKKKPASTPETPAEPPAEKLPPRETRFVEKEIGLRRTLQTQTAIRKWGDGSVRTALVSLNIDGIMRRPGGRLVAANCGGQSQSEKSAWRRRISARPAHARRRSPAAFRQSRAERGRARQGRSPVLVLRRPGIGTSRTIRRSFAIISARFAIRSPIRPRSPGPLCPWPFT